MAKPFRERPKQIRQLLAALQSLEAEIMYGHTPLRQASKQIAHQLTEPVASLFQTFAEQLEKGGCFSRDGMGRQPGESMARNGS
nr:hypothetical protein [Bacillus licheniformis]